MSSIPIALCGAVPQLSEKIRELLAPEYDVVHICNQASFALQELPALLGGENPKPASGLGSQTGAIPTAVVVGGAFSQENLASLKAACDPVKKVPWFKLTPKPGRPPGPPPPDILSSIIRKKLDEEFGKGGEVEAKVYEV